MCMQIILNFFHEKNRGITKIFIIKNRYRPDKNHCFKHIRMYLFYSLNLTNAISELSGSDSTGWFMVPYFPFVFHYFFNQSYFLDFYLQEFFGSWLEKCIFFPGIFCLAGDVCTNWEPFYKTCSAHATSPHELQSGLWLSLLKGDVFLFLPASYWGVGKVSMPSPFSGQIYFSCIFSLWVQF